MATKSLSVTELEEWGGVKCGSGGTAFSQPMRRQRDRVSVKALGIKFTGQGRPVLGRLVRFQIQGRVVVAISGKVSLVQSVGLEQPSEEVGLPV